MLFPTSQVLALPDTRQAPRARMQQCLLLAVLLHLLLVLLLGSVPPGSAAPGDGAWGRLTVSLQGPVERKGLDAAPPDSGPPGEATQRRFGGTVRPLDQAPPDQDQPGAARLGTWAPAMTDIAPLPSVDKIPMTVPAPQLKPVDAPSSQLTPAPDTPLLRPPEPLPSLNRVIEPHLESLVTPSSRLQAPAPSPAQTLAPAPLPLQALHAITLPDALGQVTPPTASLAPAPSLAPVQIPPTSALTPLPSRASPQALTPIDRSHATFSPTPLASAAEKIAPGAALKPLPSALTDKVDAQSLQAVVAPTAQLEAPANNRTTLPTTDALKPLAPSDAATAQSLTPLPPQSHMGVGSADAGSQVGHDVATPPSASRQDFPLNLNLPLTQGPRISSAYGSEGLLPAVPLPPDVKDKLKRDMEKAKRNDCRSAHAAAGLLAVVPLLIDTARDKGCKW